MWVQSLLVSQIESDPYTSQFTHYLHITLTWDETHYIGPTLCKCYMLLSGPCYVGTNPGVLKNSGQQPFVL
jgi:hypothetical protein